jgi:hypothetical protein
MAALSLSESLRCGLPMRDELPRAALHQAGRIGQLPDNCRLQPSQRLAMAFSTDQRTPRRRVALSRNFIWAPGIGYYIGS